MSSSSTTWLVASVCLDAHYQPQRVDPICDNCPVQCHRQPQVDAMRQTIGATTKKSAPVTGDRKLDSHLQQIINWTRKWRTQI